MVDDSTPRDDLQHNAPQVRRVLWITLALNLMVAAAKIGFGYYADIVSLQADGFHAVFDGLSNVIGLVAIGLASAPPDPEHPYGHQKIEVAASLAIGLMVILGFIEVGRAVWDAAASGVRPQISPAAYAVVIGSLVISLGVSLYERHMGKKLGSLLLEADSAHTLTDAVAGLAVLGGMYLVQIGVETGDILAALAVMLFIGMTAYRVLREGLDVLVDTSHLDPDEVRRVTETIDEVLSCHYVRSRGMRGHIAIDLHITVDPNMRMDHAGKVLLRVQDRLKAEFAGVSDVVVQIEPHKPVHLEDVPDSLV